MSDREFVGTVMVEYVECPECGKIWKCVGKFDEYFVRFCSICKADCSKNKPHKQELCIRCLEMKCI